MKTRLFLIIGTLIGILLIGATLVNVLLEKDGQAKDVTENITETGIQLSIGSLQGDYSIEIELNKEGPISLPYEALILEGEVSMLMESSEEVVWRKTISPLSKGNIEFNATPGNYKIIISAEEEAKNIKVGIYR
ncbi:hypothetical protein [Radiobacillus sp. PE A8.2]|uniref:hypothetical protein n=1 Tax=Radiobacillus sp. PE A8.2 TaxID=3380349 RepID=UPI00388E5FDF